MRLLLGRQPAFQGADSFSCGAILAHVVVGDDVVMSLDGFDGEAIELERFAAEPFDYCHLLVADAAGASHPLHGDGIADDNSTGLFGDEGSVPEVFAMRMPDQNRSDTLRHLLGRDVVGRPPGKLVDASIEKNHVVAIGELVIGDAEKSQDEHIGIDRQWTAGGSRHQRLTCRLPVE
jgi:hypothetical protein